MWNPEVWRLVFLVVVAVRGAAVICSMVDGIWESRGALSSVSWFIWFVLAIELGVTAGAIAWIAWG